MNHLFRELAPITPDTWAMLDDEARTRLAPMLGARKLVDFDGPHGWQHSSTSVGRVGPVVDAPAEGVIARSRVVLPLAELRAEFTLARSELDAAARGAIDVDLSALDEAAARLATAENSAVFNGWDAVGFAGITPSIPTATLVRDDDPSRFAQQVAAAAAQLKRSGIGGPYGIALDSDAWVNVEGGSDTGGTPLVEHLRRILDGPVEWVPGISGAVVVSRRGGDFVFESGQDVSLGYSHHTADSVTLYLEESFSFRIATPEAAVALV
ncbi:family 1 encapsulin nanocompartment shell protein [Herbiconiux sp. KACC 21604]|uniref:family 1 encapsulin nanocompartment shell protein n=1 Tax=unclassified Herbiconiux TaxID=2618217 RepID=UPI00149318A8|nr:family 1 encapsulin nanocompartment shell protein [Herbiconiux sp. SALV-R1]QJU52646.1 bacteriocin family protein [Herbiconiux sp. SALV-R1]WPO87538.1 family 1 encapsulin nanocompartment shell protein [Herbiconiux sp. KACC 21604]